ncbi:MAG: trehalose-6-phosphate synthase [Candidatus Omnitrophica bacterium]|nr:trehalose-6-phosphate synthase [Candidatus Omnitrophota bacterium]
MVTTQFDLRKIIRKVIGDRLLVLASNREPYIHVYKEGKISYIRPVGGAVTALDPVMRACGGIWVASGTGAADKKVVNRKDEVRVPPEKPRYLLKRIWLSKEEENGYYFGFSNRAIWPLCHITYTRPVFDESDWQYYKQVNQKFADAIIKEIGNKSAFVWIQDYHLALLAKYLKEKNPNIKTAHFWHIPWPNPEAFRICPKKKEILQGLLANDLLGFHIRYYCNNFMENVNLELEARVDNERTSVVYKGHETLVRSFPISVDFEELSKLSNSKKVKQELVKLEEEFRLNKIEHVIMGLDRIDYTKGIPEKIKAIDRFFEKYPQYKERVVFIQKGALSRIHIETYKNLNDEINDLVEEVNWRHSTDGWAPIIFARRHFSREEISAFYKIADVCLVSPLHDGMNLVAKEYVATKNDLNGVLVLGQFTGAARELEDVVAVNPYDANNFADQIKKAIEMKPEKKKKMMANLRRVVAENNIYKWALKFISELQKI